jgi:hypothetical protein
MLATFHIFYKSVIAVIEGKCVENNAVVPGVRSFVRPRRNTSLPRVCVAEETTQILIRKMELQRAARGGSVCSVALESGCLKLSGIISGSLVRVLQLPRCASHIPPCVLRQAQGQVISESECTNPGP